MQPQGSLNHLRSTQLSVRLRRPAPSGFGIYYRVQCVSNEGGYRKTGETRGSWNARYHTREKGRRFRALGQADHTAPANGTHVLSFQQALEEAQKWFNSLARALPETAEQC
jgi:hypothetical protein